MITLAIDTSTPHGAVALLRDDKPLAEEVFDRATPGQNLFDATTRLLSASQLSAKDLGLLAVGLGPGSFTGIRAGIAAAKGLALPGKLPIKGVSSFDALALTALPNMPRDCPQMCVLGDARREEIYYALYDREGRCVRDCQIGTLEAIADEIHNPIWFVSSEIERFKSDIATIIRRVRFDIRCAGLPQRRCLGLAGSPTVSCRRQPWRRTSRADLPARAAVQDGLRRHALRYAFVRWSPRVAYGTEADIPAGQAPVPARSG